MKPIKLLIVSKQGGLKEIIDKEQDISIIGATESERELRSLDVFSAAAMADVILFDVRSSWKHGQEMMLLLKEKHPSIPIVIRTAYPEDHYLIDAIAHGAAGCVLQNGGIEQVVAAIRQCANGQIVYPASVKSFLMRKLQQSGMGQENGAFEKAIKNLGSFSKREYELLFLLTEGQTNQQISENLYLSIGTVKNYISQLYKKMNVSNRPELLALLYKFQNRT
ncbi:response regulator transcription factor [Peribacillus sp. SI8-4]|uniref:LuxR C-terminal-related transcriptional regulator n=1 Tax=Peribacillus sp. SI8-4 TaxID=3048009 RepID=UPI0025575F41|nr:response regulator transcription factor [Peribacillus sp. SI8-4]